MGGDTAAHSLGDQSTFGDANVDDELFDDGMKLEDLSERYTEEGVLGKGGFGEVILATDNRLERKVAIKRIQGKAARSKTAVQRFLTEAKSIAALSHNNIVQIYDYGRSTDGPFLIMECVQGGSLLDLCRKGPIELDEAVNIFSQVCDGLAKAHAAGIIHRDIKPANILMTEDGVPKLTDFGLAKDDTTDTGMTMEGAVIGTLDFMPPEQRQGAEFTDHRSDLWSLAATFYQMLTGKSPKVINIALLPPKLQPVVAKALEESKEDRFQSAMEMREEILNAHSGKMDTTRSLGEGECPQCATPNPPHGKFCVGCGAVLQVRCLQCKVEIQIWNRACGECGSLQERLVDKRLSDLKEMHNQAESLLAELEFDSAEEKAAVVANETDTRLQQFAPWYEEFSARLESSRTSEHTRLEEQLREALAHEQAYDYETGLQTLTQVAPSLKQTVVSGSEDTVDVLTERLSTKQSRLKELEGIVRERVGKREITGLLPIVNELLTLRPDRPEVQKLKVQLEKHYVDDETTLRRLFEQEIPEIADGIITVNALARDPGHRSKIAVSCSDSRVDCVGACVGVDGNRIQVIVNELDGERIDIVRYDEDPKVLIANALTPAEVDQVLLCDMIGRAIVLVSDDQLSLAIGRRGQNVRLASKLCGWIIELMTVDELEQLIERAVTDFSALDGMTDDLAAAVVEQGYLSYDDLSAIDPYQMAEMGGLTLEQVDQIVVQSKTRVEDAVKAAANRLAAVDKVAAEVLAPDPITNTIGMKLNKIPAGTFMMGSPESEEDREDAEFQHAVTITKPFYMQTTEVTQSQWKVVMGTEPWKDKPHVKEGPDYPATHVNWDEAVAYCEKLSAKEGKTYRLPTEAEWEYACRAGTQTAWSFGDDEKVLGDYAWSVENAAEIVSEQYAQQVGLKKPNAWGLYDMHGNVLEWCHDYHGEDYYQQSPTNDPTGPTRGSFRVLRGGSWYSIPYTTRSAYRSRDDAGCRHYMGGFRVVRELD